MNVSWLHAAHTRISSYASDMITSFQAYWQCKGFLVWWPRDEIKGKKSERTWIQVKSSFWISSKWAIKINKIFVISRIFETFLLAMVMVKFTWQKGLLTGIYCPLQNPWIIAWCQKFCCWSWCKSTRVSFPPHQKANQEVGLGHRPFGSLPWGPVTALWGRFYYCHPAWGHNSHSTVRRPSDASSLLKCGEKISESPRTKSIWESSWGKM